MAGVPGRVTSVVVPGIVTVPPEVALIEPDVFKHVVEKMLDGRDIDFRARDRFQLAMSVVQELERRLPLPPFEVWAEDYLAQSEEHERYTRLLHSGELP